MKFETSHTLCVVHARRTPHASGFSTLSLVNSSRFIIIAEMYNMMVLIFKAGSKKVKLIFRIKTLTNIES